jgi:hypothetical protein
MSLNFPLSFLLIPFAIIVIYVLVFSLLHLQHLAHYGTSVSTAKTAATVWLLGTMAIIIMTFGMLRDTNWEHEVVIAAPSYEQNQINDFGI